MCPLALRGRGSAARAAAVGWERGEGEPAEPVEDLSEAVDGDAEPPHGQLGITLPGSARVGRQEVLLEKGKSGFIDQILSIFSQ